MSLSPGVRLGPYEILSPLGAGGMGEVWRAHDSKLGRDVAIKVLPEPVASDSTALARFEREAKAVAALSHPNILSIFDFGRLDGVSYAVTELLEGETFRALLAKGPLSPRRAVELAVQVARGLAAAHDRGVVHRDIKPENLFVTGDDHVKILDFGLARRVEPAGPGEETGAPTAQKQTAPGVVMGTVGYMSPEQVKGEAVDHRTDIFSFGAVLYELLSGRQAFRRPSAAETMSAILKEDPLDLEATGRPIPPGLRRILDHCLEKSATRRFHDAHDLAFALESATGSGTTTGEQAARPPSARRSAVPRLAAATGILAVGLALGFLARARINTTAPAQPRFRQLTFADGPISRGRFTRDGRSVVYTQEWDSIHELAIGNPLPRTVLAKGARLLSVSATDELAVLSSFPEPEAAFDRAVGTLGLCPLAGAIPRPLSGDITDAAWHPDGRSLAIVRQVNQGTQVEFPMGKVVARMEGGWFGGLRFSPDGRNLALLRHPSFGDNQGSLLLMDPVTGENRELSPLRTTMGEPCWRPDGREIWFSAAGAGSLVEIEGVDLEGKRRLVLTAPVDLRIDDIAPDGRVLLAQVTFGLKVLAWELGAAAPTGLSVSSVSSRQDVTPDGKLALVDDEATEAPPNYGLYLRPADGSPPMAIGRGAHGWIAPDRSAVLVHRKEGSSDLLVLVPIAGGEERHVPTGDLRFDWAGWSRNGEIFVWARQGEKGPRLWRVAPGKPPERAGAEVPARAFPLGITDPDGRRLLFQLGDLALAWVDLLNPATAIERLPWRLRKEDLNLGHSADGAWLYVRSSAVEYIQDGPAGQYKASRVNRPFNVERVNLQTGKREPFRRIEIPGLRDRISAVRLSEDGNRLVGEQFSFTSQLFLVEGLK